MYDTCVIGHFIPFKSNIKPSQLKVVKYSSITGTVGRKGLKSLLYRMVYFHCTTNNILQTLFRSGIREVN